ncbi:hypothetical protein ACFVIM_00430 [Streptomyces sp. NPDC057638]|uniref:hypothetical protein n=1 Tax=Streptomyces sp. NPDC057638 TaxID=3346190 RepID=UPI0036B3971D
MNEQDQKPWWVVYQEALTEMRVASIEPAPADQASLDRRHAEIAAEHLSVILIPDAPNEDIAYYLAARCWAEAFLSDPERVAAAHAHLAANRTRSQRS